MGSLSPKEEKLIKILHLSVVDGDIPITAIYSLASAHDSSLALPLIKESSQKLGQQPSVQQIY